MQIRKVARLTGDARVACVAQSPIVSFIENSFSQFFLCLCLQEIEECDACDAGMKMKDLSKWTATQKQRMRRAITEFRCSLLSHLM